MNTQFSITIDGRQLTAFAGQTILQVAQVNNIDIPTLCYDQRTEIYGGCGLCVVEIEGLPKLMKACATEITDGWVIHTDSDRVYESRKTSLELLLSNHTGDCRPPCTQACPAHTDCQGYVGLVANGEFAAAVDLIRERIPLPASIGRVCPHPCEDACRRQLVDQPIGIAWIKRFAGDLDLAYDFALDDYAESLPPTPEQLSGKSVAIIGAGPYGLSLAYFLRQQGHAVTIYEMMPKAGGMLRYGIPEYRLPKAVVDAEVAFIEASGVRIITNARVGQDISLQSIRDEHDAVAIGIGAWLSTGAGVPGEELDGVIGGIELLHQVVRGEQLAGSEPQVVSEQLVGGEPLVTGEQQTAGELQVTSEPQTAGKLAFAGSRVAVIGGGNTAMDACRTALRLGAEEVYCIYRRTRDEMPADQTEIEEALQEGVIFKDLMNPIEYIATADKKVAAVKLQVMQLGEADASGRRAPVAVPGQTETLVVDKVVLAIGQAVDSAGLMALDALTDIQLTAKKGFYYDPDTYRSNIEGVFVGGDSGNDRISIAVEAIADAQKTSALIDAYLAGQDISYNPEYVVQRDDISERSFEDRERQCQPVMPMLPADQRKHSFDEIVAGWSVEDVLQESNRCLECGCADYFTCQLYKYANLYDIQPERFTGAKSAVDQLGLPLAPNADDDGHPFIIRDTGKCILCGLCVRVCDELMGVGALGFTARGFQTMVEPTLGLPLKESGCINCGQCVSVCPTGALQERLSLIKPVPLDTAVTETICAHCSVGCKLEQHSYGDLLIKADPCLDGVVNRGLICGRGKFGLTAIQSTESIVVPLLRDQRTTEWQADNWDKTLAGIAQKIDDLFVEHGPGSVALAISDRYTNEEAYAFKTLADCLAAKTFSFNNRHSGMQEVLGINCSPNSLDELPEADYLLVVGIDEAANPVFNLKLKQAAEAGCQVVLLQTNSAESPYAPIGPDLKQWATEIIQTDNDLELLRQITAALMNKSSQEVRDNAGYLELKASLADVQPSNTAQAIADAYATAERALLVYQQNNLSTAAAQLLSTISWLASQMGSPNKGIVRLAAKNNSQGLYDLGIQSTAADILAHETPVKALLVFGEDPIGQLAEAATLPDSESEELQAIQQLIGQAEYLVVCDAVFTATAEIADVFLPGSAPVAATGTYTNTEGRVQETTAVVNPSAGFSNLLIALRLMRASAEPNGNPLSRIEPTDEEQLVMYLNELKLATQQAGSNPAKRSETLTVHLSHAPSSGRLVSVLPTADALTRLVDQKLAMAMS